MEVVGTTLGDLGFNYFKDTPIEDTTGVNAGSGFVLNGSPINSSNSASSTGNTLSIDANSALASQYQYNLMLQQQAQQYNTAMSNTQYQRLVKDLEAAGLNPYLAINSLSGSSPTSSANSVSLPATETQSEKASNLVSSALKAGILLKILFKIFG